MIEGLDPRWTGVQFDICHATIEGPESWPYIFQLLSPFINSLDIKDFTWEEVNGRTIQKSVPLGKGIVDFDEFLDLAGKYNVKTDFSLHLEYPLGGAEHGSSSLGIQKDVFCRKVKEDLEFLKSKINKSILRI